MDLSLLTPSYIESEEEKSVAKKSLDSLYSNLNETYPHVVVDDIPRKSVGVASVNLFELPIPDKQAISYAEEVYDRDNIKLRRRFEQNSLTATLNAVHIAQDLGADLGFIHLDDNIYVDVLGEILKYAKDAFERNDELLWLRMAATPVLSNECNPTEGNFSLLDRTGHGVQFEDILFKPVQYPNYTLWWTDITSNLAKGSYWPIAGWTTVYRLNVLERLLSYEALPNVQTLAQWEQYYKDNWDRVSSELDGKMGYINMQYVGVEMEHNENWRELVEYPNKRLREI